MDRWVLVLLTVITFTASTCNANEKVQAAARDTLKKMSAQNLSQLYKVRQLAETEQRRLHVVKACIAGLCSLGELKKAEKIASESDLRSYVDMCTIECDKCNGSAKTERKCSKCSGSGRCQNHRCNGGLVVKPSFRGEHCEKCSICHGSGRCEKCSGSGKVFVCCDRCGGMKRTTKKDSALELSRKSLSVLVVSESELKRRAKEEEDARLAKEREEFERLAREESERKAKREAELREEKARIEAEKKERLARQEAERKLAEAERRALETRIRLERELSERTLRAKEEQQRIARDRRIEEKRGNALARPTSPDSWKRIGAGDVKLMECQFPPQDESVEFVYNPIRIIAIPNGWSAYMQKSKDSSNDTALIIGSSAYNAEEEVLDFYLSLCEAAQKAKTWRKTAEARGEKDFCKKINIDRKIQGFIGRINNGGNDLLTKSDQPEPIQFFFAVAKLDENVAYARKHKSVGTWIRSLGKDTSLVYALIIDMNPMRIVIDMDSIEGFLKAANPMGCVKSFEKFETLYN